MGHFYSLNEDNSHERTHSPKIDSFDNQRMSNSLPTKFSVRNHRHTQIDTKMYFMRKLLVQPKPSE